MGTHCNDGGARFILGVTNLEFGIDSDAATEEGTNGGGAFNQGVGADVTGSACGNSVCIATGAGANHHQRRHDGCNCTQVVQSRRDEEEAACGGHSFFDT